MSGPAFEDFQKEVIQKARKEVCIELAEKMLKRKNSDEEIIEFLNISPDELMRIKHNLSS